MWDFLWVVRIVRGPTGDEKGSFPGIPREDVGNDNKYYDENSHELQEEEQQILLTLGIKTTVKSIGSLPLDCCRVVRVTGNVCPVAEAGEQGIIHAELLRE